MRNKLIPLYREQEHYTLFYNQHTNQIYKFQHRNKSFAVFFLALLSITWASKLLDNMYQTYQNILLNAIVFIIAIVITYYVSIQFYHAYYLEDTKREIVLDQYKLREYADKGLKQLRIELYSSIVSLPVSILFFIIFFVTNKIQPLFIGCIFLGVIFILFFMKPLSRKQMLVKFKAGDRMF